MAASRSSWPRRPPGSATARAGTPRQRGPHGEGDVTTALWPSVATGGVGRDNCALARVRLVGRGHDGCRWRERTPRRTPGRVGGRLTRPGSFRVPGAVRVLGEHPARPPALVLVVSLSLVLAGR